MKYGFIIIVAVAFILGQAARLQIGNIGVTFIDITVVLLSLLWIIKNNPFRKRSFQISRAEKLFGGFFAAGIIGLLLFSTNLSFAEAGVSILYLVRLLCYVSLFYLIKTANKLERDDVLKVMIGAGASIVAIGFVQYFFYQSLANLRYLGWDEHLYRLFSTFLDPNFAGAFFAIFILFLLEILLTPIEKNKRVFLVILLMITFVAELLTYSRTGFIMLLVGVSVFLLRFASKKVTAAVLILCLVLFFGAANAKIEGLNPFRIASSQARLDSMKDAVSIVQKYPVFGVGFNAYRYAQIKMGYREEMPLVQSHSDAGTDNSYLFVLATTGIVGGAFFLLALTTILKSAWTLSSKKVVLSRAFFASFVAVCVGSLFLNILFYPMILGWLLVTGALIRKRKP